MMHFVIMPEDYFNNFIQSHQTSNMYQSVEYGRLMATRGFETEYIGVVDGTKTILCAALILTKTITKNIRFCYIPGGPIIDYEHTALLAFFIEKVKKYTDQKKASFLKIDPAIPMFEHDINGAKIGEKNNLQVVHFLESLGATHLGFNNYFETINPRWTAFLEGITNKLELPHQKNPLATYKINRASEKGINIYLGNYQYLNEFYELIKNNYEFYEFNYYQNIYNNFGDKFNFYFAILDPNILSDNARALYEMELGVNNNLNEQLLHSSPDEREFLLNEKMESDKKIVIYKTDINDSIALVQKYPKGLKIGAVGIIKHNDTIYFIADGSLNKFKKFYPKDLLYAKIIEEFQRQGYTKFNFNAVAGVFDASNPYSKLNEFKNQFANKIIEQPGEFDFVINQLNYFKLTSSQDYKNLIKKQAK